MDLFFFFDLEYFILRYLCIVAIIHNFRLAGKPMKTESYHINIMARQEKTILFLDGSDLHHTDIHILYYLISYCLTGRFKWSIWCELSSLMSLFRRNSVWDVKNTYSNIHTNKFSNPEIRNSLIHAIYLSMQHIYAYVFMSDNSYLDERQIILR